MVESLEQLVKALPQELYDDIYQLTFTVSAGIRHIESTYKPPSCLQVDESTRNAFAEDFYNSGIFCVEFKVVRRWASSLEVAHIRKIHEVRIRCPPIVVPITVLTNGWSSIYDFIDERLEHSGTFWSQETGGRVNSAKFRFEVAVYNLSLWVEEGRIGEAVDEIISYWSDK